MVKATRGVSLCEFFHLLYYGEINARNTPFAVIQPWENLKDTTPTPPPYVFMLFEGEGKRNAIAMHFGFKLEFSLPPHAIVWRGVGRYRCRDIFLDDFSHIEEYNELAVYTLSLRNLSSIDKALRNVLLDCIKQYDYFRSEFSHLNKETLFEVFLRYYEPFSYTECFDYENTPHEACREVVMNFHNYLDVINQILNLPTFY